MLNLNPWLPWPAPLENCAYDLKLIGPDNSIIRGIWPTNKGRFYKPGTGFIADHIIALIRLSIEPESGRL